MGETAGRLSDVTILTSDNPRYEKPEAILSDIEQGMKRTKGKYKIIPDRREAISYAISQAQEGDLIVVAGDRRTFLSDERTGNDREQYMR